MAKDIVLGELEMLVTTKVLAERMIEPRTKRCRIHYRYSEILLQCMFALDDILIERKLNKIIWPRIRGNRLYLFYLPTNRIAIEVGVVTDEARNKLRKNFRMQLIGYRGKFPPKTLSGLIQIIDKSNKRQNKERSHHDRSRRSREQ